MQSDVDEYIKKAENIFKDYSSFFETRKLSEIKKKIKELESIKRSNNTIFVQSELNEMLKLTRQCFSKQQFRELVEKEDITDIIDISKYI
jgi:5-bromo-4-chloroindolyl phosphate hydrolysis protein